MSADSCQGCARLAALVEELAPGRGAGAEDARKDEGAILEEFALMMIDYHQRMDTRLRAMSDFDIQLLIAEIDSHQTTYRGPSVYEKVRDRALGELGYRRHLARARELDCDVYCYRHGGDLKDCASQHGE